VPPHHLIRRIRTRASVPPATGENPDGVVRERKDDIIWYHLGGVEQTDEVWNRRTRCGTDGLGVNRRTRGVMLVEKGGDIVMMFVAENGGGCS